MGASFHAADLRDVRFSTTNLWDADLTGTDLSGTRFEATLVNAATRLTDCVGLEHAVVESIIAAQQRLEGADARAWLAAQAARRDWSIEEFELWALAKMSSPKTVTASARLGATEADLRRIAAELGTVFDKPAHGVAEYRRILGLPASSTHVASIGALRDGFATSITCRCGLMSCSW